MRFSDIFTTLLATPGIHAPALIKAPGLAQAELKRRQDDLLDQALMETFPASDPIAVMRVT